jgi:hypothetical protein
MVMRTDLVMLLAVLLGVFMALLSTNVLLHSRVDEQLLGYRVSGKLPGKLVAESCLVVDIVRVDDLVVVRLELTMVLDDDF